MGFSMKAKDLVKSFVPNVLWQALRRRHFEKRKEAWARSEADRLRDIYFTPNLERLYPSVLATEETHNFTYDLEPMNLMYMADIIGAALGQSSSEVDRYIKEAILDADINA